VVDVEQNLVHRDFLRNALAAGSGAGYSVRLSVGAQRRSRKAL